VCVELGQQARAQTLGFWALRTLYGRLLSPPVDLWMEYHCTCLHCHGRRHSKSRRSLEPVIRRNVTPHVTAMLSRLEAPAPQSCDSAILRFCEMHGLAPRWHHDGTTTLRVRTLPLSGRSEDPEGTRDVRKWAEQRQAEQEQAEHRHYCCECTLLRTGARTCRPLASTGRTKGRALQLRRARSKIPGRLAFPLWALRHTRYCSAAHRALRACAVLTRTAETG